MKEEEGKYLKELNIYIIKLLNYFWQQPILTAELLSLSNIFDLKGNLAPFFSNFFYENYLSTIDIEDNLLFILTILLKKEIMNLKDKNDYNSFLDETCAGIVLSELKLKNDNGKYFRRIINKTIEKLELNYWPINLVFQIPYEEIKNIDDNQKQSKNEFIEEEFDTKIFENQSYINKYLINLTHEHIIKEKESFNDNNIKQIYDDYINMISKEEISDNSLFFEKFDISKELFNKFKINFCIVIDCIEQLISDINFNISVFPYSLKCLCKIISLLIQKKFPDINIRQRNAFIGKYIFVNFLIPLLCEPYKKLLLTDYLIFEDTEKNAKIIGKIFEKLILGELFSNKDKDYFPFNLYFIKKMKEIVNIYDNLTKVKLPEIVEKIINENMEEKIEFKYEEINKEDIIYNKFICFQFDDIVAIIETLRNNQEYFFKDNKNIGLRKTYEKLTNENSSELIQMIKEDKNIRLSLRAPNPLENLRGSNKKNTIKINDQKHYYFYISDLSINKNYEKYFNIENKNTISSNLVGATDEEIIKTNIQKVKDCIYIILENYQTLSERRFLEESIKDTENIFQAIKNTSYINNNFINNIIPLKWYLSSLFEYLEKLPQKYKDNDYDLLFNEMEKDIKDNINFLNFDFLSQFQEKQIISKKNLSNYENMKKRTKKISINNKIKSIINLSTIPISVGFDFGTKFFELKIPNLQRQDQLHKDKDFTIVEEKNKSYIICKTIKAFTKAFPNLLKYESLNDENILELLKELNIPEKINIYYSKINSFLINNFYKNKGKEEKEEEKKNNSLYEYYQEKIYDYIMVRIYDKIFPRTDSNEDNKIFTKSIMLAWTEPKHFIKEDKLFNLDGIIHDFHHYITQLMEKKSPFVKFRYLSNIFDLINKSAKYNGIILEGTDDMLSILYYLFIKEKPMKLFSNCKYMHLFLYDKKDKKEDNQLTQFLALCKYICDMDYKSLLNVKPEEYKSKCNEALKNDVN